MFTKEETIGVVTKTVFDWDAFWGALLWLFIILVALGSCSGNA